MTHPLYGKFAYAVFNRFVANDLAVQNLMPKNVVGLDGKQYPTLMPGGQTPEVTESINSNLRQHAFIVYGIENDEDLGQPYKKCESITYAIFAPTTQKVGEIMFCIQDLTSRQDWSVSDINRFEPNSGFHFLAMTFEEISGFEPQRQEGGRYAAMVSINYEYAFDNINGIPGSIGQGRRI